MPLASSGFPQARLDVTGSLTLQRLVNSPSADGGESPPVQIELSTNEDHIITLDFSRTLPIDRIGPLIKWLWGSRIALATSFAAVGQPLRVRVAGQTWLSIDIAPSRLGRLLSMPGLTLRLAGGTILSQRFRKS